MHPLELDTDAYGLPHARRLVRVIRRDEGHVSGAQMHHGFVADELHELDLRLKTSLATEIFGPDADDDVGR